LVSSPYFSLFTGLGTPVSTSLPPPPQVFSRRLTFCFTPPLTFLVFFYSLRGVPRFPPTDLLTFPTVTFFCSPILSCSNFELAFAWRGACRFDFCISFFAAANDPACHPIFPRTLTSPSRAAQGAFPSSFPFCSRELGHCTPIPRPNLQPCDYYSPFTSPLLLFFRFPRPHFPCALSQARAFHSSYWFCTSLVGIVDHSAYFLIFLFHGTTSKWPSLFVLFRAFFKLFQ